MPEILKLGGTSFHPSAANTGNERQTLLRGKNMMLRGSEGSFYFEAYGGHKNLNEPIPMMQLTGTISYEQGELLVEGVGTAFKRELRFGQKFVAGNPLQVFVVDDIVSNAQVVVQRAPDADGTTEEAYKPAHLFEIDNQRGTLVWGNALKSDRGNIIAVGEGRLRLNGAVLPGDDFVATRRLQLAIFDPNTNLYSVDEMGFDSVPPSDGVSITVVPGGAKDMSQGYYSFRWAWADSTTGFGFSNPSEVIKLDASNDPIEITATFQRFRLDFTGGLPSKPVNADSIIVYRSLFSDPTQNVTQTGEGSWFVASTVLISDLEPGDILFVDVLDGELGTEITFDNDVPPDADWVSFLAGDPILISCYGDKVVGGSDRGASPGPFVSPSRRGNRHGFPAATATVLSPPDTIIGFLPSVGRLFLLTRTGLPFAAATGQADFPVETRAFWQTGFKSPYGLVFINDTLYAFTHKGPTRSISTGDAGAEQFAFAGAVEEITRQWDAGYVHAVHDQQNEMVVLIHSADHRDEDGFWVSVALPYYLRYGMFGPLIEISKPGRDMVVTGAAAVGGKLQFLAGGRGNIEFFSEESESEEEISSEEEGGEIVNPISAAIFCCGFECGSEASSGLNRHLIVETLTASFDTGTVRTGNRSLRVNVVANDSVNNVGAEGTHDVIVGRCYIRFATLPSGNCLLFGAADVDTAPFSRYYGVGYHAASGTIRSSHSFGGVMQFGGSGVVVTTDIWYRLDLKLVSGATIVVDCQVDGTPCSQHIQPPVAAPSQVQGPFVGCLNTVTGEWFFDDVLLTSAAIDYPIGAGHIDLYVPTEDGTHNISGADQFERGTTGVDIIVGTTTAYQLVDDIPLDNTPAATDDFITAIAPASANDYVEVKFGPAPGFPVPTVPPRSVEAVVASHQAVDTVLVGTFRVSLNDNGTVTDIANITKAGNSGIFHYAKHFGTNPPSGVGEWNVTGGDGDFTNLKARFYSSDADPDQCWDGIVMEAEFEEIE